MNKGDAPLGAAAVTVRGARGGRFHQNRLKTGLGRRKKTSEKRKHGSVVLNGHAINA